MARAIGAQDDNEARDIAGDAINDTIEYVNFEKPWQFNLYLASDITTTSGTSEYTLPSALWKPYSCRKSDDIDYTLSYVRRSTLDTLFESQNNITGYPYVYTVFNEFNEGKIMVFPTPDGAYTLKVRYFRLTPRLVQDDDLVEIPRPYGVVIKDGAIARAMAYKGAEMNRVVFFEKKFTEGLGRMRKDDEYKPDEKLRFINIEEFAARNASFINPALRPRYLDFY